MRYAKRSFRRSRRPFYKRRRNYKIAKRAAKSVLWKQSETMYYDYTWSNSTVTSGDIIELLQYITRGTAKNQRVGDRIKVLGIRYHYTFTGQNANDHIRYFFALPKNQSVVTTTSVWPSVDTPVNTDVMRVYRDKNLLIDADTSLQKQANGKLTFRGGRTVTYSPQMGTMDKPLVAYFTSNHGALNYPRLWGYVRVYFKDI